MSPRLPRPRLARLALAAACLSVVATVVAVAPAPAQTQPANQGGAQAAGAQPTGVAPSRELVRLVNDFYHAAAVANYPAANALGQRLLESNPNPVQLLNAFREVQGTRGPTADLDAQFVRWQNVPELGETAKQVVAVVNQGRQALATDPVFIQEQVERLGNGSRARTNAIQQLRNSGEYAVPTLLQYLGEPDKAALHSDIRYALRQLGLPVVNPLLAATAMDNEPLLAQVILTLGDLGYPAAIPFILERQENNPGAQVQQAATQALSKLGYRGGSSNAAQEYRNLAEQFWRNESPIRPDVRFAGGNIWMWNGRSLEAKQVPAPIFDEVMAMRTAGNALVLAQGSGGNTQVQDEALSLWLAANYRREAELKPGETDPTRAADAPGAGYYGTQAGVPYLMAVLDRASAERELPPENRYDAADVSLRAIASLQEIIGQSTLPEGESPLTRAMNYPDRRVRIEAAMALAQALPTKAVSGSEQVVPLLADALSQTGQPTVLLLMQSQDELNALSEAMGAQGEGENQIKVAGATDVNAAVEQARALPGVDVFVIDTNLGDNVVRDLLSQARGNPKLNGAAKLLITATDASAYAALANSDPTIATTSSRDAAGLMAAVEEARTQVGGLPLDPDSASTLAGRAGGLLKEIGLGSSVFDLDAAAPQLLAALDDPRVSIQQLAADVVALLDGREPQQALLTKATNPDTADEVRVAAFNALAESAKRNGNQLGDGVESLLQAAQQGESPAARAAAAEAVGAMSLPVDQARQLIVSDTTRGEGSTDTSQGQ